jgi:hypothetical protein
MSMCLTGEEELEAINVKKFFPSREYGVVKLKGRPLSPQARSFIATLNAVMRSQSEKF